MKQMIICEKEIMMETTWDRIQIIVETERKKKFKMRCVEYGISMGDVVNKAIDDFMLTHPTKEMKTAGLK
jgi:hypothetical protein